MMRPIRLILYSTAAALLAAIVASPTRADVLLQTANLGPTGTGGGRAIDASAYLGARFQTTQTLNLTSVQIHAFLSPTVGNGLMFAAIVPLVSPSAFPSNPLIALAGPVEVHTFTAPVLSDVVTIPFSTSFGPGNFAVVFGSGEFGATGAGGANEFNTDIGTPSYFYKSGPWTDGGVNNVYFVVNGSKLGAATPEPGSLTLLALFALPTAGVIPRRRRK